MGPTELDVGGDSGEPQQSLEEWGIFWALEEGLELAGHTGHLG